MKKVTVSVPGKLLLMGDHAVVYGRPCLVTAVSERMSVSVEQSPDGQLHFDVPEHMDTRFVSRALEEARTHWGMPISDITIRTESQFSGNVGLGSSAAVTVGTIAALREYLGKKDNLKLLFTLSYRTILEVQGRGSGFDAAAALFGNTLYFVTAGKVIEPLPVKNMPLVVGFTGVKADTVTLMREVGEKMKAQPERVNRIYDAIAKLVEEAKPKTIEGDWERVGKLMDFNQEYLRDLGVSSEKLESLIMASKKAGAWGAKLSGAGGGDCMIALTPADKRSAVEEAITHAGGQVIHISPNAQGMRIEP